MTAFDSLSDTLLKESYDKAIKLNLSPDFIEILKKELKIRGLFKQSD